MIKYDAVIIGAGLGGLVTGATLAKKGWKVLVLEQHNIVGGAATCYQRDGVTYEVGLHEMDWGTPDRDMKELIFKNLGILDTIPFVTLPQTWRIKTESEEYTVPEGRENAIKYLSEKFSDESKGIKKYFSAMKLSCTMNGKFPSDMNLLEFFFFPVLVLPVLIYDYIQKANVGEKFDSFFKSNKLKNILDINLVYYSDDPYELSWYYFASAQYSYYHSSVFIKGGSQVLSNRIASVITDHGGEVRVLSDVQKIELEGNKAVGVTYQDRKTKKTVTVYGKNIVANCSPESIFKGKMVPEKYSEPYTKDFKDSTSLYSIYLTFKEAPSKKYPKIAYSTFILTDEQINAPLSCAVEMYKQKLETRPFVFVDYSTIDSGLVKEGDPRSFATVCSASRLSEWENLTDEEYKAQKESLAQSVFARLEKFYPGITDMIQHYEVSTPKTIQRYLKTPSGNAYGYRNIKHPFGSRMKRRASQIKNLFFTGSWGYPGGGFTGAIVSGYYAAKDMIFPMWGRIAIGTLICSILGTTLSRLIHMVIS